MLRASNGVNETAEQPQYLSERAPWGALSLGNVEIESWENELAVAPLQ